MKTLTLLLLCAPAVAQSTTHQLALNYNFNGIVHLGETGLPDDLNGYRSISDRGLNFTNGIPGDVLLSPYSIIGAANTLDIVHLGNRNTGFFPFDAAVNADNIGVQPTWLPNPDHTTLQISTLPAPVGLVGASNFSCIYQISDGGGSFDVILDLASGAQVTGTITGGDWFAGPYPGCDSVDMANFGAQLHIMEGLIDLTAHAGDSVTAVGFGNPSNANGGYAILAANVVTGFVAQPSTPIALDCNFNGIVHTGEDSLPDDLNGFRSISDRALNFNGGVPSDSLLDNYDIVDQAGVLDIVHLGNRNLVAGGSAFFDGTANGDCLGVQPTWLTNVDQSGPQTTVLASPLQLLTNCKVSCIYQISNGGGQFDITCDFLSGASATTTLSGGDWYNGDYQGTGGTDCGNPDNNLSITEGTIDLGAYAGETLVQITFSNATNSGGGYAIIGARVVGIGDFGGAYCFGDGAGAACPCGNNGVAGAGCVNGTGLGARLTNSGSASIAGDDLVLSASQMIGNQPGLYFQGNNAVNGGAGNQFGDGLRCAGGGVIRLQVRFSDPSGASSTNASIATKGGCAAGDVKRYQVWYRDPVTSPCGAQFNLSNGVEITWAP